MYFYEVLVADSKYRSDSPLVYSYEEPLEPLSVVTIPLRNRSVSGFILSEVAQPKFKTKAIRSKVFNAPLPYHCLQLAQWISSYYSSSLGDALRQFAPNKPPLRQITRVDEPELIKQVGLDAPLTSDQSKALDAITKNPSTTILLHGETGSGKTRVYLELAKKTIASGKSVIILTPEISLTTQLANYFKDGLGLEPLVVHSYLTAAKRKNLWLKMLETNEPQVVIGARSALFSPLKNPGLIVLDEAHEPAYKQEQTPRYHAARVASQLGTLTGAKVILGTATPLITDYYLADQKKSVIRMKNLATGTTSPLVITSVDLKDRSSFTKNSYLSNHLLDSLSTALSNDKQAMIYLNRRGSARIILCKKCGWQLLCPNCDIPLVYHADEHLARCHTCGYSHTPPIACLKCNSPDIVYKVVGTKALAEDLAKLFPNAHIKRFDSDNAQGEQLNDLYQQVKSGHIDILVGTQLLAKGLDLPKLGMVGIIAVEASLTLPDYTSEERAFQLLYQVIGRVGRGHAKGQVIIQTYEPDSLLVKAASSRNWQMFYKHALAERQQFRFPPYSYLLKLVCKRATLAGAENAASELKKKLHKLGLPVEVIGPSPAFYARRGKYFYYQLIVKSKNREHLLIIASILPAGWSADLDPSDLL